MGKKQRRNQAKPRDTSAREKSDESYRRSSKPDPTEDSYYFDEVDEFHNSKNKILLDEGAEIAQEEELSEEEVLGVDSSSDEDEQIAEYEKRLRRLQVNRFKDEHASDISGAEESSEDEESKAWGTKRSKFYGADFSEDRRIDFTGERMDPHVLEEQEAVAMEKRMAEQLDEADFGLDIFQTAKEAENEKEVDLEEKDAMRIEKDLSLLSKHEKLKLIEKESPEMMTLIQDFRDKLSEAKNRFLPVYARIKDGTLGKSKGTEYIQAKVRLLLNYCVNISFYMMLKAKRTPVHNHPVVKRLVQYRNLIQQMEPIDKAIAPEVDALLDKIKSGQSIAETRSKPDVQSTYLRRKKEQEKNKQMKEQKTKEKKKLSALLDEIQEEENEVKPSASDAAPEGGRSWGRKRSREEGRYNTAGEKQALEYYAMMRTGKRPKTKSGEASEVQETATVDLGNEAEGGAKYNDGIASDNEEMIDGDYSGEEDGKRAITYEMAKNKGLMPKRKKEQRNPRVKNKLKYRKAKIRRRGQIREVRTEITRYEGELSGIRAGVKKSTKFKN